MTRQPSQRASAAFSSLPTHEATSIDSIQQLDGVALPRRSFDQHLAINPGPAAVHLRNLFQKRWRRRRCIGIERDRHAARVAFHNGDDDVRSEAHRAADDFVLREAIRRRKIQVNVRAALVPGAGSFLAEFARGMRLQSEIGQQSASARAERIKVTSCLRSTVRRSLSIKAGSSIANVSPVGLWTSIIGSVAVASRKRGT